MKEPRPPLTREADPERVFQRRAHRRKRGRIARRLDPREPVTRIRREQPRQVLRLGQRRAVRQRPSEIFAQARAHLSREGPRCFEAAHERGRVVGQPERFELRRTARRIRAHQYEVARVRH